MVKWKDEVVEYPTRREISPIEGDIVEITKNVGKVYQNKTPVNAENLNDTQDRIDRAWGDNPNIDPRVEWVDHKVEFPNRYKMSYNSDGTVNIIPHKGKVIQQGTPVNAENLNKMENRIDNMINIPTDATATPNQLVQGYTAYVGQMKKITGAMKNNSGISKTLTSQGETYVIPEGYQDGTSEVVTNISGLSSYNIRAGSTVGGVYGGYTGDLFKFIRFKWDDSSGENSSLSSRLCDNKHIEVPANSTRNVTIDVGFRPDGLLFSRRLSNYSLFTDMTKPDLQVTSDWSGEWAVGDTVNDYIIYLKEIHITSNGFTLFLQNKNSKARAINMNVFAYKLAY